MRIVQLVAATILCVGLISPASSVTSTRANDTTVSYSRSKMTLHHLHRRHRVKRHSRRRHYIKRAPNTSAATWQMPWQIRPIVYAERRRRERIVEAFVPKTGQVRGTRIAIATIGMSLRPAPGPNRTVKACRAVVAKEAAKLGAREVEAVSAGPEHLTTSRKFVAPVKFRITYKTRKAYEVRISVLSCVVSRRNKLLNAYVSNRRSKRA